MKHEFRRIAIVNRGEAAVRLIRAVREMSWEKGEDLRTIALYTDSDRRAAFVRESDEAVYIGTPVFVDPGDGRRKNRYLDYAALEQALRESGAEAAWVGWGFVAEHAQFAVLCRNLGVVFIGPDPEVMRALGDKIGSKRMAQQAGLPVAPWSEGPVESLAEARQQARRLGFPLMVKATAGGGGRGIRRVRSQAELAEAFESARSEALAGFGDSTVFMERLLEGARHVEVQIIGDGERVWALGVRDCTVQRRNQKILEESPSPALNADQHREICAAAARLGERAGYRNAGTVEFLYDPNKQRFSFMEVNARLQVEHPVTECTTGVDLVKLQLHVARGGRLVGAPPVSQGHAIEARVNAEDPERGFAPAPGVIELLRIPGGPGLRLDSGFVEGDRIAPHFDSMLAKVIATGRDRNEALSRLRRALAEMQLAVRGGATNRGFLLGLLDRSEVRSGKLDVGWLDRLAATGDHLPRQYADVALVQAAIDAYDAEIAVEQAQFYATAARGRLRLRSEVGFRVELRTRGRSYELQVFRVGPQTYRVESAGLRIELEMDRLGRFERRLLIGERSFQVLILADGPEQLVEVDGIPHRLSRDDAGTVRALAPAVVLSLSVQEGDDVAQGDQLAVLEAMKTELPVLAPCAGKVRRLLVSPNVQVDAGQPILVLEPSARTADEEVSERVRLDTLARDGGEAGDAESRCRTHLKDLRRLMLGFDIDPAEARRLAEERRILCGVLAPDHPDLLSGEDEILAVFADECALFERHKGASGLDEVEARTPEEYLLLYLRSLDPAAAGLSPGFVDRLGRALAHYGLAGLERTPELEETILWICKAYQRFDDQVAVVLGILERRLDQVDRLVDHVGDGFRGLLDRIVIHTRGRHQAVSDLAREVRYRYFDQPFFERARNQVYANAEAQLAAATQETTSRARAQRVRALVDCPEPLAPLILERVETAEPALRQLMLEILARRYYRIRKLENLRVFDRAGGSFAVGDYRYEGARIRLVTTWSTWQNLDELWPTLREIIEEGPCGQAVAIDLCLRREQAHSEPDASEEALRRWLDARVFPRSIRRVVALVSAPGGGRGMGALQHFTFRCRDGSFHEERVWRGLHPMMGKRLELWRLSNFEIERLPSVEDVYLFLGVSRSNPKDERLFAVAEVRDLTPMRGPDGRILGFPHLEMQYYEALGCIRLFQSRRSSRERLHWNRVVLHVWPPLELSVDELNELAHRLAPAAAGLGLQKTVIRARVPNGADGKLHDTVVQFGSPGGREVVMSFTPVANKPIAPVSEYGQRVVRMRQRGMMHPYELVAMLTPSRDGTRAEFPPGEFIEHDLDGEGRLAPVERLPAKNVANVVVGVIRNYTNRHPEGMSRVALFGDPSRELGSFAEPECRRIIAAVDLAGQLKVPLEWYPISAGAKIALDSGTENLDWTAAALRRLIELTQAGGEVNIVVAGVNVGGQSYWNAEATMLMHTRGVLIMTPEASMVLTGKRALDYSGGISAEDNQGIGGYERTMGVNGEAQYWARDIGEACHILFRYYEHTYVAPGERFPRRVTTSDPIDRDVRSYPYGGEDSTAFATVGEIFSDDKNPGRRKPFEIRRVMRAVVDQDHAPLERWTDMREAEVAVVWDAHLGGYPVCLLGIESHSLTRLGFVPADGPDQWTAGTLFPLSSKKVARAINAASGNRPVVVLANLSGFDGSPESMRRLQLEYGAEIGRAVVNFAGPIVFCVISRYHGGAYVVFSPRLNSNVEVAALEGSYASVIGGAPAAAVVFAGQVDRRTRDDPRLQELEAQIAEVGDAERRRLRARWHEVYETVHAEKLGEVADEFDQIHNVYRAQKVGSLQEILAPGRLRPYLVEAVERGMRRTLSGFNHASRHGDK